MDRELAEGVRVTLDGPKMLTCAYKASLAVMLLASVLAACGTSTEGGRGGAEGTSDGGIGGGGSGQLLGGVGGTSGGGQGGTAGDSGREPEVPTAEEYCASSCESVPGFFWGMAYCVDQCLIIVEACDAEGRAYIDCAVGNISYESASSAVCIAEYEAWSACSGLTGCFGTSVWQGTGQWRQYETHCYGLLFANTLCGCSLDDNPVTTCTCGEGSVVAECTADGPCLDCCEYLAAPIDPS